MLLVAKSAAKGTPCFVVLANSLGASAGRDDDKPYRTPRIDSGNRTPKNGFIMTYVYQQKERDFLQKEQMSE